MNDAAYVGLDGDWNSPHHLLFILIAKLLRKVMGATIQAMYSCVT